MAKQLNVNLAFQADTSQAKQAIMDLQSSLSKVATMNISAPGIDANKIKAASNAAKELSVHLNSAFNANTGKLDLSKLNQSLKTSGTNVTQLSSKLLSAGAQGEQAFVKLAQSIAAADRPLISLNSKMSGFLTVLKNTARWQISSSILHGFIGSVQQAYGYAQDLNESLNNIRIVSGQTTEQMARFAEQANRAAKSLSTTTTAYTNAALIFYQQGLSGKEVTERADIVSKMANVSGQSAEMVSDQMTAIWNNFYDGSESLESYSDKITALGAATASSSDEIATGLEKFAAAAETVGLSYDYATAALATVTATTRQSAEVVGTAFKTLFARLNDLKLGETLDDGTTLGQYTENLAKVGVNIKDASGELKDMDQILEETATKWQALDRDQQVALAKGVAGIRQYSQFIALMDNWDFMKENLQTVEDSGGALQDQADIYAESWDAASKRARASLETIYSQILDDEFFIDITNGFASLMDSISAFVDGIGGVKTILIGIGSIFLSSIANKIQPALMNLGHTFKIVFQSAQQQSQQLATEMNEGIRKTLDSDIGKNLSESSQTALKNAMQMNEAKAKLQGVEQNLTATEKQRYELELQLLKADQDQVQAVADKITKRKEEIDLLAEAFDYESSTRNLSSTREREESGLISNKREAEDSYLANPSAENKTALTEATNQLNEHRAATERLINAREQYAKSLYEAYNTEMKTTQGAIESSTKLYSVQQMMPDVVEHYTKALSGMQSQSLEAQRETFARLKTEIEQIVGESCPELQKAMDEAFKSRSAVAFKKNISEVMKILKSAKIPAKDLEKILSSMGQNKNIKNIKDQYKNLGKETKDLENRQRNLQKAIEEFNPKHVVSGIERITQTAAGLGQVAMAASSLRSIFQAWNNDDLSLGEKITTTFMSISMLVPAVIGSIKSLNIALNGGLTSLISYVAMHRAYVKSLQDEQVSSFASAVAKRLTTTSDKEATLAAAANLAVKKGLTTEENKQAFVEGILTAQKNKGVIAALASKFATWMETGAKSGNTLATIAQTVANWGLLASMPPLLAVSLVFLAALAALALIIWGVVSAVEAITNAYNADAIAAENAETAAKNLAEAYKTTKQEYEDMIAAMENYQSAREGLDSLTKGTEEYRKALKEANRQALELINQYGLIEGRDYSWVGDELIIKQSALDSISAAKEREVDQAYAASQMSAAEASRAKSIANQTALQRQMRDEAGVGTGDQWLKGILDFAMGGVILGTISTVNRGIEASKYNKAIDKAIEESKTNANLFDSKEAMAKALNLDDDDLIDALWENKEAIQDLSTDMNAAAEAEKVAAQNTANEIMAGTGFSDTKAGTMALNAGGELYQQIYGDAYDKFYSDAKSRGAFNTGTKESKKAFEDFAKETGLTELKNFKIENYKGDGTVEYSYIGEDNKEETKIVTAEEIAATLASVEASTSLEKALQELKDEIVKLNLSDSEGDHGLAKFISDQSLDGTTKAEYDAIAAEIGDTSSDASIEAYLDKKFGDGEDGKISNETAVKYGFDDAADMIKTLKTSLQIEWEVPQGFGDTIAKQLSAGASGKIQNTYEELGAQGGMAYINTINAIASGADWEALSPEEQTNMLNELANLDWSAWDAGYQAVVMANKYGVAVNTATEAWQENISAIREATGAVLDTKQLVSDFEKINDISKEISIGKILSVEDYNLLVKYNQELSKYFTILSDGTAVFSGDILDFQDEVKKTDRKTKIDNIGKIVDAELTKYGENVRARQNQPRNKEYNQNEYNKFISGETDPTTKEFLEYVHSEGKSGTTGSYLDVFTGFIQKKGYEIGNNPFQDSSVGTWESTYNPETGTSQSYFAKNTELTNLYNLINDGNKELKNKMDKAYTTGRGIKAAETPIEEYKMDLKESTGDAIYAALKTAESVEELAEISKQITSENGILTSLVQEKSQQVELEMMLSNEYALVENIEEVQELSEAYEEMYGIEEEAANRLARSNYLLNQGLEKLYSNFDKWKKGLSDGKYSQSYIDSIKEMRTAISELTDISEEFISDVFITEKAMKLLERAVKGDAEAITELEHSLAKDMAINIAYDNEVGEEAIKNIRTMFDELDALFEQHKDRYSIGKNVINFNEDELMQALGRIVDATGMTVAQANELFQGYGFSPIYSEDVAEEGTSYQTITATHHIRDEIGPNEWIDYETVETTSVPIEGGKAVLPGISAKTQTKGLFGQTMGTTSKPVEFKVSGSNSTSKPSNKKVKSTDIIGATYLGTGASVFSGPSNSGGGGSEPKKTEKTRKADVVDRYKEINDQLDDVKDAIEAANLEADGLWGPARIKKMKEVQKQMEKELKLLRQKKDMAKAYLEEDRKDLQQAARDNDVAQFIFDGNNNITNYDEIMGGLYAELRAAQDAAGPTTEDEEQKKIDAIQERIDALKEAIDAYDATKEELEDFDKEIEEYIRSIQEQHLEQLNLELEVKITVDDSQLAEIEYYLSKSNEDIWSMAEALALMTGQGKDMFNFDQGQAEVWVGKFEDYQKRYNDLVEKYTTIDPATGETYINQQQFVESLVELQQEVYSNLQSINELDKSIVTYYGDTLAAAGEELSKFTSLMEHHVSVLDHYSNLMDIMGKSKDYERMKLISGAQVEVAKNAAVVSKANYEMLAQQAKEKKAAYDALDPNDSSLWAQTVRQQWFDAQTAANEAEEQMLADANAWAEQLKTDLEIRLSELGDILDDALSGEFGSMDFMMTSLEHAQSLQEEFLTTTNKIYETDKMIKNAQKEIDKTSNQMAKNKLKQFINETAALQEQGQLSQFELDIQQAKYDLLLAEIALKEAQNAKSTVRLQRDSEGNFGYVYTADQTAIDDAQQKYADSQNALYNISLDGANKYTEQYIQTMKEMNDAITELYNDQSLTDEERQARRLELEAYYHEKLSQFSYLYSVAAQTDARVVDEAWSSGFANMTTQTSVWMAAVQTYAGDATSALSAYQAGVDQIEREVGLDLDSLKSKTEGIKTESNDLTKAITDPNTGLISAMDKELDKVTKLTEAYTQWRAGIQSAIDGQETLADLIGQDIENESDDDESNDKKPEVTEPDPTPDPDPTPPEPEATEPTLAVGDTVTIKAGSHTFTNGKHMADFLETGGVQRQVMQINGDNVLIGWGGTATGWVHKSVLEGFDTGGYTGAWGSYGKMAMLHEKELVLNAGDTENFLASLEFLHKILEIIDLQAMSSQLGGVLSSPGMQSNNMNAIEQNVHIEASFPNAVNHSEIEEAFNNLINTSSQFANKK